MAQDGEIRSGVRGAKTAIFAAAALMLLAGG